MRHRTRRGALRTGSIALLGSLAGCSAFTTNRSNSKDVTIERLSVTAVYVADEVDISLPPEVPTVDNAHNADLLILPDDTNVDADQVVEWLADDRVLAIPGDRSEATWLSWARSDAFRDAFNNEGYGESEPDPSLVVGAKIELVVKTYRYSWGDGPTNRDVLRALDESLVAIENEMSSE